MKYIDADRLRAELEKRLKNVRDYMNGKGMKYKGPKFYKAQGKESVYDAVLNIIDFLRQEQQECIYGRTLEERQKYCKFCSAFCKARIEQKQELPLMNGDTDLYFDEWNQQQQNPTKRQCFEEGMRYAERLQKEQKPAEWSEYDEDMLAFFDEILIYAYNNNPRGFRKSYNDTERWLKSIRPKHC